MLLLLASGTLSIGLLFWIIMLVLLIFGFWANWPAPGAPNGWRPVGFNLVLWVLLFLLGWSTFGFPVSGP